MKKVRKKNIKMSVFIRVERAKFLFFFMLPIFCNNNLIFYTEKYLK